MSDTDSFIDEVTEEVRRDRLFAKFKRYGWIGVVIVLAIVGGTAYREYSKAQEAAQAQALGDSILSALETEDRAARIDALAGVDAPEGGAQSVLTLLLASEEGAEGDDAAAVARLQALANDGTQPQIYRQIASFKALTRGASFLPLDERRAGFEALAVPGQPLRLLAEEQLALIEVEQGARDAALTRLQGIIADAEVTTGLRRRASQLIVALGGELEQG
ncbi:tetratricopeptide repeat protein [Tropicibacter alexandrii]|uniref:tetratricopeptide repeat protein n=1 Tax=Tropicibacter alexandrii TaxID=2267683 RepID=UPI001008F4FB|nr:tetratricopeptide repeat protein [Tropicibacter alexandrii]